MTQLNLMASLLEELTSKAALAWQQRFIEEFPESYEVKLKHTDGKINLVVSQAGAELFMLTPPDSVEPTKFTAYCWVTGANTEEHIILGVFENELGLNTEALVRAFTLRKRIMNYVPECYVKLAQRGNKLELKITKPIQDDMLHEVIILTLKNMPTDAFIVSFQPQFGAKLKLSTSMDELKALDMIKTSYKGFKA